MNEFNNIVIQCFRGENQDQQIANLQQFLLERQQVLNDLPLIQNYPKVFKSFVIAAHDYLKSLPTAIINGDCVTISGKIANKFLSVLQVFQPYSIFSVHNLNDYINVDEVCKFEHLYQLSFSQKNKFPNIKLVNCWIKLLYVNKQNRQLLFQNYDKMKNVVNSQLCQGDTKLVTFLRVCSVLLYLNYFLNQADQTIMQKNISFIIQFSSDYFSNNLADLVDQLYKYDINKELGIFNDYLGNYLYNDVYNDNMLQQNSYNSYTSSIFYQQQTNDKQITILQYIFDKLIQTQNQGQQKSRQNILDTILEQIIVNVNNQKLKALDYCINLDILNRFQQIRENLNIKFTDTIIGNYMNILYKEINQYMLQYHLSSNQEEDIIYFQKASYLIENYSQILLPQINELIYDSIKRIFTCINVIYKMDPSLFHIENEIYLFNKLNQYQYNSQIQKHINNLKNIVVCLNGKLCVIRLGYQNVNMQMSERIKNTKLQYLSTLQQIVQGCKISDLCLVESKKKFVISQKRFYEEINIYNGKQQYLLFQKQLQQNGQAFDGELKEQFDSIMLQNKQYVVDLEQSHVKLKILLDYDEEYVIQMASDLFFTLQDSSLLHDDDKRERIKFLKQINFLEDTQKITINKDFPFNLFECQVLSYIKIQLSGVTGDESLIQKNEIIQDQYQEDKQLQDFQLNKIEALIMKTVKLNKIVPIKEIIEAALTKYKTFTQEIIQQILKQLVSNAYLDLDEAQNVFWPE